MDDFNFSIRLKPRFFDLDVYRHVNNAAYSTYCEEARVAYCRHLDIFGPSRGKVGFVIAEAELRFLSPVKLGEEVEIFIRSESLGRATFEFAYLMTVRDPCRTVFTGRTKCVCWDLKKSKPAPLGPRERKIMTQFEEGPNG